MANLHVKKGDTVVVVAGKEKGKTAKVLEVSPKDNRVLVENVNVVTKHQKQRNQQKRMKLWKTNQRVGKMCLKQTMRERLKRLSLYNHS